MESLPTCSIAECDEQEDPQETADLRVERMSPLGLPFWREGNCPENPKIDTMSTILRFQRMVGPLQRESCERSNFCPKRKIDTPVNNPEVSMNGWLLFSAIINGPLILAINAELPHGTNSEVR
jgi:hypothetical protein